MNAGLVVLLGMLALGAVAKTTSAPKIKFKQNPSQDGHRAGAPYPYWALAPGFDLTGPERLPPYVHALESGTLELYTLRCGVCPTYFQKICAFSFSKNSTYIFDNHCIMDVYNCIESADFVHITYEHCVYFGNFAYVHGFKYEDEDYGENHIIVKGSKKNPPYV